MDTKKTVIAMISMLVLVAATLSISTRLAASSARNDKTGIRLYDPIDSCSGYAEDGDKFRDCPIQAFAVPGAIAADGKKVDLFGAGCPKAFTDFTNQKWCLFDVSPDNGSINTCSYNNC
jgi:hypothetical protein